MRPVLVNVAKAKMTFTLGSIAIAMFAAMVTLLNLERAEDHSNFINNFVTDINVNTRYLQKPPIFPLYTGIFISLLI